MLGANHFPPATPPRPMPKPTDASEPPAPEKRPSSDGQPLSRPAVAPIKTAAANGGTIPRPTATPVIEVRPPSWHGGPPSQYPFLDEVRAAAEGRPREPDTPVRRRRSLLRSKASPDLTGDTGLLGVIKNQLSNSDLKGAAAAAAAAEQVDTDRESVESVEPVTGLAYASEADNNYFHRTFPAIPDDDRLINDYVCAINNTAGVLIQGRIYISQHHFAFKGWTGNAIWKRFTEVKHIEKKNVALVIPNAIEIETDERTFFFASFLQRDDAFDLLCKLWDSHVSIHSLFRKFPEPYDPHCTCEGLGTCESCYKLATRMKDLEPQKADEEQRGRPFLRQLTKSRVALRSLIGGEGNASDSETPPIRERSRDGKKRASNTSTGDGGPSPAKTSSSTGITAADESRGSETSDPVEPAEEGKLGSESATPQVPDRKGRPAAQCGCADRHAKMTTILDKEYPVPIETLWKMMYTLEAGGKGWLAKFLTERKLRDIMVGPWTEDSDVELQPIAQAGGGKAFAPDLGDVKVGQYRRLEYIMPLVQPLGPKQTTCILRDEVVDKNEDCVCLEGTSRTPDVPSGGAFHSASKVCLTHAGDNRTRVLVSGEVVWSKSSWLKAAIDKGVIEGMKTHHHDLDGSLSAEIQEFNAQQSKHQAPDTFAPSKPTSHERPAEGADKHHAAHVPARLPPQTKQELLPTPRTQPNPQALLGGFIQDPHIPMLLLSLLCVSMVAFLTAHTVVLWKLTRIVVMFDERLDRMEHVRRWGGAEECAPRFVVSNGAVPADLKPEEIRVKGVADRVVPRREDVRVEGRGAEAETY